VRAAGEADAAEAGAAVAADEARRAGAVALLRAELEACGRLRAMEEGEAAGGAAAAGSTGLGPGKWPTLAQAAILQSLLAAGAGGDGDADALAGAFAALRAKDPRHRAFYRYAERSGATALAAVA